MSLFVAIASIAMPFSLSSQCFLACNDQLEINLNQDGIFVVTPTLLLQGNIANCPNIGVQLFDDNLNLIGDTISCDEVGTTVIGRLIDFDTNTFCDTDLNVTDKNGPVFTCTDLFLACNADTHPDTIGYPSVYDNCTSFDNSDLTYSDQLVDLACFAAVNGEQVTARLERTWLVSDASGNQGQCIQNIYLRRATLSDVVFPPSLTGATSITCGTDDPNDLSLTGVPLIAGKEINPNGLCDISVIYSDQVFNSCGGSATTFRTWTALDACTNTIQEFDQIIELEDKFGPEIMCPDNITVNANSFSCDGTVTLPVIEGTDECSSFTVTSTWEFGQGPGPFTNIPVGQHLVTYIATDDCNNNTVCSMVVNIVDNTPPTPICENSIGVSLLPSGDARIFVATFDEGSFDNCAIDRYEVRRDTQPFGPFVDFTCADVEAPFVLVQLRVTDDNGLFNDCWIQVTVNDNFAPTITCPSTVIVDCQDDVTDLSLTGIPTISDACGVDTFYYEDTSNLSCGVGTIQRRWTTIDANNNTSFCVQTIEVVDNSVLDIVFPNDITIDFCTGDIEDTYTGIPSISGIGCKNILTNKEDQTFSSSTYCYTIFRTWTVINWCEYDPNSGSDFGEYTHVQRIDVVDFTAPEINCLADTVVLNFSNSCGTVFVNLDAPTAEDCSGFSSVVNDSQFANNLNGDASGFYPNGTHIIEYTAFDNCGNANVCQQTIEVRDGLSPNLLCRSGIVIEMTQNGSVTIDPSLLIASISDNCTPANLMNYTLSQNTFTCADVGLQTISLSAIDQSGNSSVCVTTVEIQDNMFACSSPEVDISGRLLNLRGEPVSNLEVSVNDSYFSMTDATGFYTFENLPAGQNYTVDIGDVPVERRGVTTFDMVLIVAHILQTRILDDPYKIIAVDVDNNNSVSVIDIVGIRQLILEQVDRYSSDISWKGIDANYVFTNPNDPLSENYPTQLYFNALNQDVTNADFVAVKLGDVDGDGTNLTANSVEQRNENSISLIVDNAYLAKDELKEIKFKIGENIATYGLQFDLFIDKELVEFVSLNNEGQLSIDKGNYVYDEKKNSLKFSWTADRDAKKISKDDTMFSLKIKANKVCRLNEIFKLRYNKFNSELYDNNYQKLDLNIAYTEAEFKILDNKFRMSQNYPNPVLENTFIKITSHSSVEANLLFTNLLGQRVFSKSCILTKGENLIELFVDDFSTEKILFYSLEIDGEILDTKKMIRVCP
jgi:hypothetical protein